MDNAGIKNRESIMDDIDDIVHYSVIVGMKKAIEEKKEKS